MRRQLFVTASVGLLSLAAAPPAVAQEEAAREATEEHEAEEEEDEIVVQATRSNRRVQDEPIRVEVIGAEEIDEKAMMTPGNISMLMAETGGVRVQVTSPALGASNVRMQGMNGRYTQLLADGLPLYGGSSSSVGLLQIAPTDLGRVEIIKGSASALYGPSALGGVINLVSRRPEHEPQSTVLFNATSRDGQDLTGYGAAQLNETWAYSLVGGLHRQSDQDLDDDGWIDMSGYERWTFRPRLFWEGQSGANAFVTLGAMNEEREGGTRPGALAPDGQPFAILQESSRLDGGAVAEFPIAGVGDLHLRASAMTLDHRHQFGALVEEDQHDTAFAEVSLATGTERTSWLIGAALQADTFESEAFPIFDYDYSSPGVFAQVEHDATETLTLAASARYDDHSEFGAHFSPRISMLYRPGPWRVRASYGQGFYAPTPFVEEIEAAGLSRLEPLGALEAEIAQTASFDVGYSHGPIELSATLFASDIEDAVQLQEVDADTVRLVNADGVTRTRGVELLARYRWESFVVTGSYVYVDASEPDPDLGSRRTTPETPRNTAGIVAMWEEHGRGRLGVEAYYTGEQELEDNPYRTESEPYVELGILGEITLGNASLYVNFENILDVRQTREDSLLRPARAPDGRWTVDAWAPLDGFTVNAGVRLRFGGGEH
ncbi:MAG: TonB-dependent receptor [Hyphomonadaceae bacterium]|nr:TonB-dependent receptor [Hyphomonadaceae bacterium]